MDFGKWIVVAFVTFALFIGTLVTVCVRQEVSLVAPDYYNQELAYQQQIERRQNADALAVRPKIAVKDSQLIVTYPGFTQITKGQLKLIRPADPRLDETFTLQSGNNIKQSFDLTNPQRGLYKINLSWSMGEKEYFIEEMLYLN